jgi:hypothetical protein
MKRINRKMGKKTSPYMCTSWNRSQWRHWSWKKNKRKIKRKVEQCWDVGEEISRLSGVNVMWRSRDMEEKAGQWLQWSRQSMVLPDTLGWAGAQLLGEFWQRWWWLPGIVYASHQTLAICLWRTSQDWVSTCHCPFHWQLCKLAK